MASMLVVVRLLAILLLDIQFIFGNTYDWETVKDVLSVEIFDLKAKNKQLESRIDKMESMMQTRAPISYQSGKTGTDRIQTMEKRISDIETKMSKHTQSSRNSLNLKRIVTNALRSEKMERLKSELKIEAGLREINDSLEAFNVQSDAVFALHVSDNVAKLASQTNSLIDNKITTLEMSINATQHDVLKMGVDLNSVIDIVLLNHTVTCEPNCVNDGVCFRNNVCKCKPFTEGPRCEKVTCEPNCLNDGVCFRNNVCKCKPFTGGPRCEKVICEDKCYENGGKCVGPGNCECPEYRQGPHCEQYLCSLTLQEGISLLANSRLLTGESGTIQTFNTGTTLKIQCDKGYRMQDMISKEPVKNRIRYSTCNVGNWTHKYECIPEECSVPKVSHASLRDKAASQYKHREKVTFICDDGFNFGQNVSTKVTRFETFCNFGNWTDDIPQECKEDGCRLDIHEGSYYYVANTNESITYVELIEHLADIQLQCMDTHDLFNDKNEIHLNKPYKPTVTCYRGKWRNAFFCKKMTCEPNCVNDGVCFRNNVCKCKPFTEGPRSEKVICDNKCDVNGGRCIGPDECACPEGRFGHNCEQDSTTESYGYDYDYDYLYESMSADILPVDSKSQSKIDMEGCLLPKDAAKYKDSQTVFSPGETLTAFSCPAGFILSSHGGMTCQGVGWSNIVKCVEAAVYLISVKTGKMWLSKTNANVSITLHGLRGTTDKINLRGSFEADDLDETRVSVKDVGPITSVVIGSDGSGFLPDWYLEYVSIYVENMEEYYVFRHNGWVVAGTDIDLPRQGNDQQKCIDSFDSGNLWSPSWNSIGRKDQLDISNGKKMSLRGCKQACINLQTLACVALSYDNRFKTCWGFAVSDKRYLKEQY